ncbi:unnamed protein product [marine sediment metagenome]|uniref:Uncharacterized protein n=1 Tax=marine sediment metagenome TaxID=412755 RepID=X1VEB7_9ZZZZ
MTKKVPDCQSCHHFIRVDGRPACTNIPQKEGKPAYMFLKALKTCWDFWRVH